MVRIIGERWSDLVCCWRTIDVFGAVMIAEGVAEVFERDESGRAAIGHGYTYSGHPVGAAAALACLAETQRLNVKDNAAARGAELFAGAMQPPPQPHDSCRCPCHCGKRGTAAEDPK